MILSISHPELSMVRVEVNNNVVNYIKNDKEFVVTVDNAATVCVFFEPWGIKPFVRIDGHLIDYWLANVLQFDHMISFQWSDNFYDLYQQRNIESKIQYLGLTTQEEIDYYLGINNSNLDLVNEIKLILNAKSLTD